ncbi:MAG TPA: prepilin-type N-terminal cleavage/methylation domain-containing protein [Myxococcales bacterium]|nr:prepilin-type N-terminal cleavage/methylation domain-containing protein [Myxococcales bacterium]HIK84699.1 prepilin-type N-terminal cleavage/methylation domain-containing protein [Myxococcales bacterium]
MSWQASRKSMTARQRAGLTLVEIMVAMVVLSFGLLGVAAMQVRAITEGSGGRHLSDASAIARNRVEALVRQDWAAGALADSGGAFTAPVNVALLDQTYGQAERITDIVVPLPGTTQIKMIEVRITWNDQKRLGRSVVLSSARLREPDE